jgi:DNA-binding transcriptional LysR family regulator
MLQAHDEALALLQGRQAAPGALRIGSMETTAALRLPPLLAQLHQRHPGMALELRTGPTASQLAELLAGQIDCAFVAGLPPQARLTGWPVFRETLVLVGVAPLAAFPRRSSWAAPFPGLPPGLQLPPAHRAAAGQPGHHRRADHGAGHAGCHPGLCGRRHGYALLPQALIAAQQQRFGVHWCPLPPALAGIAQVDTCFVTGPQASWSRHCGRWRSCCRRWWSRWRGRRRGGGGRAVAEPQWA